MKCNEVKRIGMTVFAMTVFACIGMSQADAGTLLDELQVQDTCGTTYADKLASCTPFKCQKPSPMAIMFGFPPEEDLQKMPPERQKKMRTAMAAAEKKMQSMSLAERAEMKEKMVSILEIKGYNAQHQCQIETGTSPKYVMRCTYDAPMLKRVSGYERIIATADHVESDNSGSTVNGKWVTKSVTKVDGKIIDNPLVEAMNKKICKSFEKDADQGLIDFDQLNHMSHFEFNLSEHGNHVDGHIQILNVADGKVLFDKDVNTSKNMRKINLKPGTFDIKVTSKNTQLAPVWFRGVKLGEANVFKKSVEFYAITGTLKLTSATKGEPKKIAIYMTDPDTNKWIYHSIGFNEHEPKIKFLPTSIKLPETLTGKYEVFVAPVTSGFKPKKDAKYKHFTLNIHKGEIVEKAIDFNGLGVPQAQAPIKKATGQNSNTLFILDASGSMWGQIKGKPKITIAKEVMAKLVPELPDNARIGLIAYGHRRKGDCNDVETLVKLGANDKQAVLKAVKGLNAKGKTPLNQSVSRAFKMLQATKQPSTIILVSDGIESCNADPCKTVKAAKKYGVQFVLHTIGFGLSKGETDQLQCMAKAGGGQYFAANDAQELLQSTRKAVKSKGPGHFKLTLHSNGKPVKAWVKLSSETAGLVEFTNDAGVESGHLWTLQPGTYQLETKPAGLQGVDPMVVKGLLIESGKTLKKQFDFDQAVLRINVTDNGKPVKAQIYIDDLSANRNIFNSDFIVSGGLQTPYEVKLLPGKYRMKVKLPKESNLAPYSEEIDLTSNGKPVEKTINFETDILRITALKNAKPVKAQIYVDDLTANRNIFNSDFIVSGGLQTPYEVTLLPGKYRLTVNQPGIDAPHTEELDIGTGEKLVEKTIRFEGKSIAADASDGMEQNTDRPGGGDFRHLVPDHDDPSLCQKACQADAQCKSWTYVKPNTVQGPQPNCWLKTGVPPAMSNSCCVSGVKK